MALNPAPTQERDGSSRVNVVLAVLLPEHGRPLRSKEFQHQRADFARRLRTTLEQPHVTLWHQPNCPDLLREEGAVLPVAIDDLFVVGVCELCASLGNQCQKKKAATVEL